MDQKVREFFSTVQTGVVTDAMYLLHLEGWMQDIFPLRPGTRVFGPAFTVQASPVTCNLPNYSVYELSELWQAGDVMLIDGLDAPCALMGENMAHTCQYGGLSGLILNGRCRDYAEIRDLELPVFAKGPAMRLKKGFLCFSHYNVPLNMASAHVNPGDYILGDMDGVLVFPAVCAEEIMYQTEMIVEVEKEMEQAIRERWPIFKIKEIARKKSLPRK
ncbi:MAG: RraA family protein [Synergistaceae bacterium]|jgi:regulator of RNase E activity RraA|nr:RraA family protein [Synergistaceae bacterium]